MSFLLDTHILLWWLDDAPDLPQSLRGVIAEPENEIYLSAVVIWEIRIKEAIGKLTIPKSFEAVLAAQGFTSLSVTADHAHEVGNLPMLHRDPFDRMLIAQARQENLALISGDAAIAEYEVEILWT